MPLVIDLVSVVSALASVAPDATGATPRMQAPTAGDNAIVVVGRRLEQARYAMTVHRETGEAKCWITVSSGDEVLDKQLCAAVEQCARLEEAERIQACVRQRKGILIFGPTSRPRP